MKKCSTCMTFRPNSEFGVEKTKYNASYARTVCNKCRAGGVAERNMYRQMESSGKSTYLVTDGEFYKIGTFTDGKLEVRVRGIQTGNPRQVRVVDTSCKNIEVFCHRALAKHRVHGEWFRSSPEVFTTFTEMA